MPHYLRDVDALRYSARLLVVLTLVVGTQSLLLVEGTFLLRRDYVAKALCVDRAVEGSDCGGMCFLSRQLEERQRRQEEERSAAFLDASLQVSCVVAEGYALARPVPPVATPEWPRGAAEACADGASSGVFHPPRVA